MSKVALLARADYQDPGLTAAVTRAVDLAVGGMAGLVRPGMRVLIKPNLLSAHPPEDCVTTHPAVIRAVVDLVQAAGGRAAIGDSPALHSFSRAARASGAATVALETGAELQELTPPVRVATPGEARFTSLELGRPVVEADLVINLPKLKAHGMMLLTLGVKNCFGAVVAQRKAEWHHMVGRSRENFASLLLDIHAAVAPGLTILDGVWGMHRDGPSNGEPFQAGLIAASCDTLALDLAVCDLLGIERRRFPLYRAARERGMLPAQVELVGDDPQGLARPGFIAPELDSVWVLPRFLDGLAHRHLVSRPVQDEDACQGCGQCVAVCPQESMVMEGRRVAIDYARCIRCYCCQEVCPADAIGFKKGWMQRVMQALGR